MLWLDRGKPNLKKVMIERFIGIFLSTQVKLIFGPENFRMNPEIYRFPSLSVLQTTPYVFSLAAMYHLLILTRYWKVNVPILFRLNAYRPKLNLKTVLFVILVCIISCR